MIQKYLDLYSDGIILSGGSTKISPETPSPSMKARMQRRRGDTDDVLGPVISAPDVPP